MPVSTVSSLYSGQFDTLREFFYSIQPPYTLAHIREFNAIYRRIYPQLSREEKRRAEEFVDALIAGLENPEWASKIFGVV
ncbi:hypothetical protein [Candidatus Methylocalor cossyra]